MIPREATNENRFLIFTPQAAIFSLIGFGIGLCFVFIPAKIISKIPTSKTTGTY
jgi:hypothetical protein